MGVRKYIEFEPDDPENPYSWSSGKRWFILMMICSYTFLVSASGAAYPPGIPGQMKSIPGYSNQVWLIALALYAVTTGVAPLILAPLSEVYGRKPVFLVSCLFFGLFKIAVATANNVETVLLGMFFSGIGTGVGNTMVGGIVVDLFYHAEQRDLPMATFVFISVVGTSIGEVVAAYVADSHSLPGGGVYAWRWIHWFQLIWTGLEAIYFIFFMPETRASVLLSRRAEKMRRETGDAGIHAQADLERESLKTLISVSLTRPFHMFLRESIVISLSLYITLCWALLYLFIAGVPKMFGSVYGFRGPNQNLPFLAVAVGSCLGFVVNFLQMRLYRNAKDKSDNTAKSQSALLSARLYLAMPFGIVLSISLLVYAWTSRADVFWLVPVIAITLAFTAIFTILLAVFNCLSDCYKRYASSALSAQGFLRNLVGGVLILAANPLYDNLGFQWGSALLGFISAVMTLIPFVLFFKMQWIRSRSHFAGQIMREEEEGEGERKGEGGLEQSRSPEPSIRAKLDLEKRPT